MYVKYFTHGSLSRAEWHILRCVLYCASPISVLIVSLTFDTGTKQASQNLLNIHIHIDVVVVLLISTQEPNKHHKIFWIFIILLYFWFGKRSQTSLYFLRIFERYILEWMTTIKHFFRKMQKWFGLMVVVVIAAGEGELCNNGWDETHDIFCVLLFLPSPHRHLDYRDH